ncbi:MAG: hypothetical protein V1908_00490 [Candidatus Peregrinibacteria bacterium]
MPLGAPILSSGHPLANLEEAIRRHLREGCVMREETMAGIRALFNDAIHRGITYVERLPDGTEQPIHPDGVTLMQGASLSILLGHLEHRIQIARALRFLIGIGLVRAEPGDTLHERFLETP